MARIDDLLMQCCQEGCIYHPDQPAEGQIQLCYYQGSGYALTLRLNCEFRLMSDEENFLVFPKFVVKMFYLFNKTKR